MSDNSCFRGRTEANLEGIAKAQDAIWKKLDALSCTEHAVQIEGLRASQGYTWAMLCIIFVMSGGILVKLIIG